MNSHPSFERELSSRMGEEAAQGLPPAGVDEVLDVTRRLRPRPRWLALLAQSPMQTRSRVLVGSPMGRLVFVGSTVLLVALAAFVVGGGAGPVTPPPGPSGTSAASDGLQTVSVSPDPTTTVVTPGADCTEVAPGNRYLAIASTLPVTVTVPGTATGSWWAANGERFVIGRDSCDPETGNGPFIAAALVGEVYADACQWRGSTVETPTAFEAAAAFATQTGHEITAPVETTVGPFRATRLDVSVPATFDASGCNGGEVRLWPRKAIVPGTTVQVYVAEVDGSTLVITATYRTETTTPADLAEMDELLASLRVDI